MGRCGSPTRRIYDALGPIYRNPQFAHLFPKDGQPALAPAQLALVTVFQFVEGLSDRQAADAVRGRIDWKYALCLPLEDPGFDASVLVEFRSRLIARGAETLLFEALLTVLKEEQLVKPRSRQRTDSTHVLAAIHVLNRLELVGETLRHALNTLATVAPEWLRTWAPSEWFDRYTAALVYALVLLWYAGRSQEQRDTAWPLRPWSRRKSSPSFPDMLAALRRDSWHLYISRPPSPPRRPNNPSPLWPDAPLATA